MFPSEENISRRLSSSLMYGAAIGKQKKSGGTGPNLVGAQKSLSTNTCP